MEVELHVDVQRLLRLLGHDVGSHVLLKAPAELGYVLLLQRQSDGVGVAAKVLQQVAARLYGLIDVESGHRAGRA